MIATLAACQTPEVRPAEAQASDDGRESVAEIVAYGVSLRALDDVELEQLHRDLTVRMRSEPSSALTIRLALLLSYRDSSHYDLDRAINLFNQVARTRRDENPVFRDLAELMATMLIERRSVAVDRDALAESHTADVERIEALQGRIEGLQADLAAERERSGRLQSQLDALIELEEQLTLDAAQGDEAQNGE